MPIGRYCPRAGLAPVPSLNPAPVPPQPSASFPGWARASTPPLSRGRGPVSCPRGASPHLCLNNGAVVPSLPLPRHPSPFPSSPFSFSVCLSPYRFRHQPLSHNAIHFSYSGGCVGGVPFSNSTPRRGSLMPLSLRVPSASRPKC